MVSTGSLLLSGFGALVSTVELDALVEAEPLSVVDMLDAAASLFPIVLHVPCI